MTNDELDRLCAEKIMGWNNDHPVVMQYEPTDYQPTRNIAQAWELLEKISHVGVNIDRNSLVEADVGIRHPNFIWCEIWNTVTDEKYYSTEGTAPLAIVKACLKAKGVEIE